MDFEILNEEELEQLRMDKEADFDDLRREIRDIYGEIEERKNKDNESLFSEEK